MTAANWLRKCGKQVSPFGEKVATFLDKAYGGIHNVDKKMMDANFLHHSYISVTVNDGGNSRHATYDSDVLTRMVFLAHAMNIRFSIQASTHGYLKLIFCEVTLSGFMRDRHPTLDESLEKLRYILADTETPLP